MWFHVNSRRVLKKKTSMRGSRHVKQSINLPLIRSYSDLPVSPFRPIRDIWVSVSLLHVDRSLHYRSIDPSCFFQLPPVAPRSSSLLSVSCGTVLSRSARHLAHRGGIIESLSSGTLLPARGIDAWQKAGSNDFRLT